jgi:hypothetical protein
MYFESKLIKTENELNASKSLFFFFLIEVNINQDILAKNKIGKLLFVYIKEKELSV